MVNAKTVHILDTIPFEPDLPALHKRLHIREGSRYVQEFSRLLAEAQEIACPRALYQVSYITGRGEDWVQIEDVRFASRVLSVNLHPVNRVFPFLSTCGIELQQWVEGSGDMLVKFWAEAIKEAALACATNALFAHIQATYQPGNISEMSPGSLEDWPLTQQRPMFDLIGGIKDAIGVRLEESMMMIPAKTISGICFPTEVAFESCQLCPRENCPGRRAEYDSALYEKRYQD